MDDFEDKRVQRLRKKPTLFEQRYLRGVCPMCTKKVPKGLLYCGAACSQAAESHQPLAPETEEEKKSNPG